MSGRHTKRHGDDRRGGRGSDHRPTSVGDWLDEVIDAESGRGRGRRDEPDAVFEAIEHLARRIGRAESARHRDDDEPAPRARRAEPAPRDERMFDAIESLERRLDAIAQRIDRRVEPPQTSGLDPLLNGIRDRLDLLSRRIDEAGSSREPLLDGIRERLDGLSRRIEDAGSARDPLLDGIRDRLDGLAARIEGERAAPPRIDHQHDQRLARIEEALAALSGSMARQEPRPDPDALAWDREVAVARAGNPELMDAVREIAARQKALEDSFDPEATIRAIDGRLARYSDDLSRRIEDAPRNAVADMQERLRAIVDPGVRLMQGVGGEVGRLQAQVADLKASIAQAVPGPTLAAMVDEVRVLSAKMDEMRRSTPGGEGFGRLEGEIGAIRRAIETATPREALSEIDAKIGALGRRLDDLGASTDPETIRRISAQLGQVQRVVAEAMPTEAFQRIARDIAALDAKVDQIGGRSDTAAIDALRDEIVGLRLSMAKPSAAPGFDKAIIDDFRGRFEQLQTSVAERSGTETAIKALEARLQSIGERIETPEPPGLPRGGGRRHPARARRDGPAHAASAAQRHRTADRRSRRQDRRPRPARPDERALTAIEAQVKGLAERLGEMRRPSASEDPVIAALTQAIETLKSNGEVSERRTTETLSAVHDTLRRVVDRLADIDQRIAQPRLPAAGALPSSPPSRPRRRRSPRSRRSGRTGPSVPPRASSRRSIRPRRPARLRGPDRHRRGAGRRPARLRADQGGCAAERRHAARTRHRPAARPACPPGGDRRAGAGRRPLRRRGPGSGRPRGGERDAAPVVHRGRAPRRPGRDGRARSAPEDEAPEARRGGARRAAFGQTRQGREAREGGEGRSGARDRRTRRAGIVGRVVDTLKQRRKQVVMALGALVVLVGALQVATMFDPGEPAPATARTETAAPSQAPARSEARIPSAPATAGESAAAAASGPARPAAQRADMPEVPAAITSTRLRNAVAAGDARAVYEVGLRHFEGRASPATRPARRAGSGSPPTWVMRPRSTASATCSSAATPPCAATRRRRCASISARPTRATARPCTTSPP